MIAKNDSLGMDLLYRVNLKAKEFRLVAPFVEHALEPRKPDALSKYANTVKPKPSPLGNSITLSDPDGKAGGYQN